MRVTDGEDVLVPLYHGTSKRFLPSIRESGLGGRYPSEVARCHDLLDDLAGFNGWDWSGDAELCSLKLIVDSIRAGTVTAGGFNFRYGNTYVSASCRSAVRYATSNRYGSELLTTAMDVLEKLFDYEPSLAQQIAEKHQISPDLRYLDAQPVLVEAKHVPVRNLKSERGEAAGVQLNSMQELADKHPVLTIPVLWDQMNFELISPVPSEMLRYYEIRLQDGTPSCLDFTLVDTP